MSGPLVSIVIPAYNMAGYLPAAIDSVLAQDYPDVELIVLDDGSTDGTREVLARYSGRLRGESQPNMGQAATLNKGWAMARGGILSYLAADDLLAPHAVTRAVAALAGRPDVVLAYGDFDLIDPAARHIRRVHAPDYDYRELAVGLVCAPGPGVFFRRAGFEAAGAWNPQLRQIPDFEYWLRLALQGPFLRIPEVLASYRVHDESQSFARVGPERADEMVAVMRAYYASPALPAALSAERDRALSNAHVLSARLHLRAGRLAEGFAHLRSALALWPANFLRLRTLRLLANALLNRLGHKLFWQFNRLRTPAGRP